MCESSLRTALLLCVCLATSDLFADINICLPENGGVLQTGPEAIRDNDFDTVAQQLVGQSGSMESTIVFDQPYHVTLVEYQVSGATYQYDGGARAWAWLDLQTPSGWQTIQNWSWSTWQSYTDRSSLDNGGIGWDDVTAVKMHGYIEAFDTGTSVLNFFEMQVYAVPEPATIALLGTLVPVGLVLLWKRRRKATARQEDVDSVA